VFEIRISELAENDINRCARSKTAEHGAGCGAKALAVLGNPSFLRMNLLLDGGYGFAV
jgi:hypothetical protein